MYVCFRVKRVCVLGLWACVSYVCNTYVRSKCFVFMCVLCVLLTVCACRVLCSALHQTSPCLSSFQITPAMRPTQTTPPPQGAKLRLRLRCVSCCEQDLVSKCCLASQVEAPHTPACKCDVSCQAVFWCQVSSKLSYMAKSLFKVCQGLIQPL